MPDEAVGFTAEDAGRIGHAVRTVEADPGPAPLGRQYGGRRGGRARIAVLKQDLTSGKQVEAEELDEEPDRELQLVSLRGNVNGGGTFTLRLGADGSESGAIPFDATDAQLRTALAEILAGNQFAVTARPGWGKWWIELLDGDLVDGEGNPLELERVSNDLETDTSRVNNVVLADRVDWRPSGRTVDVRLALPIPSEDDTPLAKGTQVVLSSFGRLGFGVIAAESRSLATTAE